MYLSFLQTKLPLHKLSLLEGFSILTKSDKDPIFCLLPKFPSLKKAIKISSFQIVWILPISEISSYLFRKKLLFTLQPLYFLFQNSDGSLSLYDYRYLKTENSIYKLPPVDVDITTLHLKTSELQEKESLLFPKRDSLFYFRGDTTDRLQYPSYEKALFLKKHHKLKKRISPFYLSLKRLIDD